MFELRIPRHACSPRGVARAGELWRLVQEAAVLASEAVGWPAERYKAEQIAFVVGELAGVHAREATSGEVLPSRTGIAEVRRGMLFRRETWIGTAMRASVQWAHVGSGGTVARASPEVIADFGRLPAADSVPLALPVIAPGTARPWPSLHLEPWLTEMDPLGHTNHPRYVDWADEALARGVQQGGGDPQAVVPRAEWFRFRTAAVAGQPVELQLTEVGTSGAASVFNVRVLSAGRELAEGRLWRELP